LPRRNLNHRVPFELAVQSQDFDDGYKQVMKFSTVPSVTQTEIDVWGSTGRRFVLASAVQHSIVSDSADDDLGGLGAEVVTIGGLDNDWNEITEDVVLNGTSAVTTTQSFLRVNRAYVKQVGIAPGANVNSNRGNLTIRETGTSTVQAFIEAELGQTQGSHYSVPAGKTAVIMSASVSSSSDKAASVVEFMQRQWTLPDANFPARRVALRVDSPGAPFVVPFQYGIRVTERSDMWALAYAPTASGANQPAVNVTYQFLLLPFVIAGTGTGVN